MELLIALTLVSLMLVMLFGGLRLGSRSWDAVELRAAQSGDQRLVWGFLQRTLTEMQAVYLPADDAQERVAFSGNKHAVEFVGRMPERLGPGGGYLLRLEIQEAGTQRNLILRRWLYHPEVLAGIDGIPLWKPLYEKVGVAPELLLWEDQDPAKGGLYGEHVLIEDIEALEIAYYGDLGGSGEPEWHDQWFEVSEMPILIRLRLQTAQGEWPPLFASPPDAAAGDIGSGASPASTRRARRF